MANDFHAPRPPGTMPGIVETESGCRVPAGGRQALALSIHNQYVLGRKTALNSTPPRNPPTVTVDPGAIAAAY